MSCIPLCSDYNLAKISLLFLAVIVTSCNTLRRVGDGELLITKNTIYADSLKIVDEDINSLIVQKPNSALMGYPLRLNLYNLANENPDSSYQAWLYKKGKKRATAKQFAFRKTVAQTRRIFHGQGFA